MSTPEASVQLRWEGQETPAPPPQIRLKQGAVLKQDAILKQGAAETPSCVLIEGDNRQILSALSRDYSGTASLVYLDPPFLTGRVHQQISRSRGEDGHISRTKQPAFDDRWEGLGDYLSTLKTRLRLSRELLAPHGSLVVHVDPKTSHYIKVLCDEIFGIECFASEIIWRYRRWPSKTQNFQRVHDVLLRYVKDATHPPRFQQLYEPLAPSTQAVWGTKKQRAVVDESGKRQRSSRTAEQSPGTPLGDVWDIGIVAPVAKERTGYPTQKPQNLLERLISALTFPGDWVVDPYLGSGTTAAVCAKLERRCTGIDKNPAAIELALQRLSAMGVEAEQWIPETPKPAKPKRPHHPSVVWPNPCSPAVSREAVAS